MKKNDEEGVIFPVTCYHDTNKQQEVIFFANPMLLKPLREKNVCPTFLPLTRIHFFMMFRTYLQVPLL